MTFTVFGTNHLTGDSVTVTSAMLEPNHHIGEHMTDNNVPELPGMNDDIKFEEGRAWLWQQTIGYALGLEAGAQVLALPTAITRIKNLHRDVKIAQSDTDAVRQYVDHLTAVHEWLIAEIRHHATEAVAIGQWLVAQARWINEQDDEYSARKAREAKAEAKIHADYLESDLSAVRANFDHTAKSLRETMAELAEAKAKLAPNAQDFTDATDSAEANAALVWRDEDEGTGGDWWGRDVYGTAYNITESLSVGGDGNDWLDRIKEFEHDILNLHAVHAAVQAEKVARDEVRTALAETIEKYGENDDWEWCLGEADAILARFTITPKAGA